MDSPVPQGGDHANSRGFLAGGGDLGARLRSFDWRNSRLGDPETWPRSLKTAVRIMLTSRQPIWIGWGSQLIYLYNDPYKSIIGGKHPWALGRPTEEVWREIWPEIGPMLATAMRGDEGTYVEEQLLIMERSGFREETYYTFSYSPIPDDDGNAGGIICANTDDTARVIGERQLVLLREIAAATANAHSVDQAVARVRAALATEPRDLPFALLYLAGRERRDLHLSALTGLPSGHEAAPEFQPIDDSGTWPLASVLNQNGPVLVDLGGRFQSPFPAGAWKEAPRQAALIPIGARGEAGHSGILVAGLNPFRLLDDNYSRFLTLTGGEIGAGIANAEAYEEERRRAEALAEIDRAKTVFFSNVSHEFRTPLTLLMGPLEDVLNDGSPAALNPAQRERLEIAHRNSLRLLKLVNTLLDFSRIEAGRIDARFQPADLARLTADLASTFRSLMEKAGLELNVHCEPLAEAVFVDPGMWERIVLNLLSNAFKYTLEGKVDVVLQQQDQWAELTVSDTGVGIPAEELPRLFERFHRIEGQPGRSFEGSGIGLALIHELVKLHGGAITVTSEPGKGTRFTVRIPMGTAHLPADRIVPLPESPALTARSEIYIAEAERWLPGAAGGDELPSQTGIGELARAGPGRILLADDNADLRSYAGRLLRERGYDVLLAENGEAALSLAKTSRPDLILSDVMMPRMDGFGLLKALRADPELRDTPVILLSARAGEEARTEGLIAGADDYLTKPFAAGELLTRIATNMTVAVARREERKRLEEETRTLETLNRIGKTVAAELDLETAVQTVTDAATQLSGAEFGAFFYNLLNERGESYTLYTLSGAPREAFAKFPMPRNTHVFGPTFRGEAVVRSDDITRDPRYGKNPPYQGMPQGHLPVRSYLAAPVLSRSGEVIGGLFFGHSQPAVFDDRAERVVTGIASQAAIAIDNARLYRALRDKEEVLAKLNTDLEKRVEERTEELASANRQLLGQIEQRERVEATLRQMQRLEAVGQLTSGVAHDFNNLLTVVLGNISFLERSLARMDEKTRLRLSYMRSAAERGARLTSQLLAFSRRQRLEPKSVDLNEAIENLSDLMRSTIGASVSIELDLSPDLWPAMVDPTQIELVVLNLTINARDAMKVGGTVAVETANVTLGRPQSPEHPAAGQYVMIAVRDTGTGMSDEVLAKCFEPFFTTKEIGKGSGLGLSQVLGFAKQSGGGVAIETQPGSGTTVRVYLPRAAWHPGMAESATAARPQGSGGEKPISVLLVDDDADVREITAAMLDRDDFIVHQAGSGARALELLEEIPALDAAVVDFAMPGMNGAELADNIRKKKPNMPVLFVTGYADAAALAEADEAHIIRKPFLDEQLTLKIQNAVQSRREFLSGGAEGTAVL